MAFAQPTDRERLRDIEACLHAVQPTQYPVGIRTMRALDVNQPLSVDWAATVYALDATTIELCLSVFPLSMIAAAMRRCMTFAQITYRESLRDIEACLRAVQPKLYHLGIRTRVNRPSRMPTKPVTGALTQTARTA